MAQFYAPNLQITDTSYFLTEEESKHCIRVLRMQVDDSLELINGKGLLFQVIIIEAHPKKCAVKVLSVVQMPAPKKEIHIAIAPTKNMDRMEWFVEKAGEIGLTKLSLIKCHNSERKVCNLERMQKIAIAAMKQSKQYYLPEIEELISFNTFLAKYPKGMIAHCYQEEKTEIATATQTGPLLIGPEGDFSKEELALALKSGYLPVSLGENRLRTETAALLGVFHLSIRS